MEDIRIERVDNLDGYVVFDGGDMVYGEKSRAKCEAFVAARRNVKLSETWDDIGRYWRGDQRAWAFVNYVLSGTPYN